MFREKFSLNPLSMLAKTQLSTATFLTEAGLKVLFDEFNTFYQKHLDLSNYPYPLYHPSQDDPYKLLKKRFANEIEPTLSFKNKLPINSANISEKLFPNWLVFEDLSANVLKENALTPYPDGRFKSLDCGDFCFLLCAWLAKKIIAQQISNLHFDIISAHKPHIGNHAFVIISIDPRAGDHSFFSSVLTKNEKTAEERLTQVWDPLNPGGAKWGGNAPLRIFYKNNLPHHVFEHESRMMVPASTILYAASSEETFFLEAANYFQQRKQAEMTHIPTLRARL